MTRRSYYNARQLEKHLKENGGYISLFSIYADLHARDGEEYGLYISPRVVNNMVKRGILEPTRKGDSDTKYYLLKPQPVKPKIDKEPVHSNDDLPF